MSNKIEMSEAEIIGALPILSNIMRQRSTVSKGQYNLKKIIEDIFQIAIENKLEQQHRDLFQEYTKEVDSKNERGEDVKSRVFDESKQEEYYKAFDDLFKTVHTINRKPVTIDLLEGLGLKLTMEELQIIPKIIVEN